MDITIIKFTIHYPAKTRKICHRCKRKRYISNLAPEVLLSGSHIIWSCKEYCSIS